MAISSTSICNMALLHIGVERITSFSSDTTERAVVCREFYEPVRDALLQQFPWSFAGKRVELSPETTAPVFGYASSFLLPADYLAVREIDGDPEFIVENGRILCDSGSIKLAYTFKQTADAMFSPLFVEMFSLKLARAMVGPLKRDTKDLERINALYEIAEVDATDAHSKEDSRDYVDESDDLLGVR